MDNVPDHNTLLGFDFGMKRIGVAVGQTITASANPLPTLKAQDGIPNWDAIETLIKTWHADGIIVGIPLNMDGTEQNTTRLATKFANRLHARFNLPVYKVDERLTTVEARQHTKTNIDSYAAKLILESWLREQQ